MLVLLLLIYNLDAVEGEFKYHWLCYKHAGGRYYESVQKNAGWIFEGGNSSNAKLPFFYFPNIGFVRFNNAEGGLSDLIKDKNFDMSDTRHFIVDSINESRQVKYLWKNNYVKNYQGDKRFNFSQTQIINLETGNMAATFTKISYGGWLRLPITSKSCDRKVLPTTLKNTLRFRREIFN